MQPFEAVTTTVYVPASVTLGDARFEVKLPGPDQKKSTPVVLELPIICPDCWVQVKVSPVATTFGKLMFCVTV